MEDDFVSFDYFCDLLSSLRSIKPRQTGSTSARGTPGKAQATLSQWIRKLRTVHPTLPPGTTTHFFRLLFPDEGVRRRYDLKEDALSRKLEAYFRTKRGRFANWSRTALNQRSQASGCLGIEVEEWLLADGRQLPAREGGLSLKRVDELLDELASLSKFSADSVRFSAIARSRATNLRTSSDIIKDLLDPLSARSISFMIQIILRDLHPILYALPTLSGIVLLRKFNSFAFEEIGVEDAMRLWDERMLGVWKVVKDLDYVTEEIDRLGVQDGFRGTTSTAFRPVLGIPVAIPVSTRPGTCERATRNLSGLVAVETKYDGERLQIHVDMSLERSRQIKIFSKSGRDSTETRRDLRPIIRAALGLDYNLEDRHLNMLLSERVGLVAPASREPIQKLIIEGEMVSYNEEQERIDEFWTLAALKQGHQPQTQAHRGDEEEEEEETYETGETLSQEKKKKKVDKGENGFFHKTGTSELGMQKLRRHLMIVWYDLVQVNDRFLHNLVYEHRRTELESIVSAIHGFSMLAESVTIDFGSDKLQRRTSLIALRLHFATIIAKRMEGLMLKPLLSRYNDDGKGMAWAKLKKDFIPGAGDTKDFHIIGARWQRDRGRKLFVPPSIFTTFFVGLRADHLGPTNQRTQKPHFHVGFAASYGLDRPTLDTLCSEIRGTDPVTFDPTSEMDLFKASRGSRAFKIYESHCTTFTFSIAEHLDTKSERPTYILRKPRVVEMTGAGFQKAAGSPYYELRWPRITKIHREDGSPLDLKELEATAMAAMRMVDYEDQVCSGSSWNYTIEDGRVETQVEKFSREVIEWVGKLERADRIEGSDSHVSAYEAASRSESDGGRSAKRMRLDASVLRSKTNVAVSSSPPSSSPIPSHLKRRLPPSKLRRERAFIVDMDSDEESTAPAPSTSRRPLSPPKLCWTPKSPPIPIPSPRRKRKSAQAPSPPSSSKPPSHRRARNPRPKTALGSSPSSTWDFLSGSPSPPTSATAPFWSIFPPPAPCSTAPPRERRSDFLQEQEYLCDPLNVLWCAGRLKLKADDGRTPYSGSKRAGVVFVKEMEEGGGEEAAIDWLRSQGKSEMGADSVWLLPYSALDGGDLTLDLVKQSGTLL